MLRIKSLADMEMNLYRSADHNYYCLRTIIIG